ncbi:ferric reductase-like transmembrane domain-containing protein [Rhodococcus sp. NPDC003318]|uniref:ferredoxin reductase family protein n=1 Tax=Rhodococcus sp. NPDC003318 TaxID=3364503 RepID=UPI0036A82ABB
MRTESMSPVQAHPRRSEPARTENPTADPFPAHRFDTVVRYGALVAFWLNLLVVTYWWTAGGGIRDLGAVDTALTSVGRLAGLVSAALLLVQVLLIARIPVLERAFGQDELIGLHRVVGITSFVLMVGHVGIITWGYAGGDIADVPSMLWDLTVDYPGMLLAVAGTLLLLMIVVTSVRPVRDRLRYESWHLLHLYAYLGVGLALPHQLWTGQEFLASAAATIYWWTLWALAAAAVLVWRVGLPVWRNARHRLRVTAVVPEGNGVVSVHMAGRALDRLPADAGQFFQWRFVDGPGWTRANPYSLSAAPDGRSLRISVKDLGDGSARTQALTPGTPVLFEGPYGRLSGRARSARRVALIGAGVGATPLRALAEGLDYGPGEATLLLRYTTDPLFVRELQDLSARRGLQIVWLPGPRRSPGSWLGNGMGEVDDRTALTYWAPDIADRDVYVCGPEPWTDLVRRTSRAAGVPAGRIHTENFGW